MKGEDVEVIEARSDVDLAQEALATQYGPEFRPQQLKRHLAAVLEVLSEIDRGHAARADLFLDGIAVG